MLAGRECKLYACAVRFLHHKHKVHLISFPSRAGKLTDIFGMAEISSRPAFAAFTISRGVTIVFVSASGISLQAIWCVVWLPVTRQWHGIHTTFYGSS